jgi:hypothetical protein
MIKLLNKNMAFKYSRPDVKRIDEGEFLLASVRDKEYNKNSVKRLLLSTLLTHSSAGFSTAVPQTMNRI